MMRRDQSRWVCKSDRGISAVPDAHLPLRALHWSQLRSPAVMTEPDPAVIDQHVLPSEPRRLFADVS